MHKSNKNEWEKNIIIIQRSNDKINYDEKLHFSDSYMNIE